MNASFYETSGASKCQSRVRDVGTFLDAIIMDRMKRLVSNKTHQAVKMVFDRLHCVFH